MSEADFLKTPIESLELGVRYKNALRGKFIIAEDLLSCTIDDFRKLRNFGKKGLEEVCCLFAKNGYQLLPEDGGLKKRNLETARRKLSACYVNTQFILSKLDDLKKKLDELT